jgi:capsular exopolysaccharide synthesis family protein
MLQLEIMALANGKVNHENRIQHQGALTLLVTSSIESEGKSLIAANLAASIAQTGRRVLLVDANCRSSVQNEMLDVDDQPGLIDALTENAAWDDIVKNTSLDNLYLVTTGVNGNNKTDPSTILMSPHFDGFIKASKEKFDFVIFDSASATLASEAAAIGSRVDGVILVIKANDTRRDFVLEAKQRIQNSGGNILGAVLNC